MTSTNFTQTEQTIDLSPDEHASTARIRMAGAYVGWHIRLNRDGSPQAPLFPSPMDYSPGCDPPAYSDARPFTPLGLPGDEKLQTATSRDLEPDHSSLNLVDKSIKEMEDCEAVFDGLSEGIEKRHGLIPMDRTERELRGKVVDLRDKSVLVLASCRALRSSTRSFLQKFLGKLDEISSSKGGILFPDDDLRKNGNGLLSVSRDMSKHVTVMLKKLEELAAFVQSTKDSGNHSLRKKIWEWLVRAFEALKRSFLMGINAIVAPAQVILGTCVSSHASYLCRMFQTRCKEEDGFATVLNFLQSHLPDAAKKAESNLKAFLANQLIFRNPLGVSSIEGVVWIDKEEALRARNEWYHALVTLDVNEN